MIYFHGTGHPNANRLPIVNIFIEMAEQARWDILRINRLPLVDFESQDDDILQFVEKQISRARQDGYTRIILAGHSRGGWLALSGAALDGVDGVIGFAPGTVGLQEALLERQRDELARRLSTSKATRVAAFFFEDDPREYVKGGRGPTIQRALQSAGAAFMVVDQPPDLSGHSAAGLGRFTRRYRDCLLQFMIGSEVKPGENHCDQSGGYAVGSDIQFPSVSHPTKLSPNADKSLAPYLGRWEGDDEHGAYVIMESTETSAHHIGFRYGYSPSPRPNKPRPWVREIRFQIEENGEKISYKYPSGTSQLTARLKSPTELELEASFGPDKPKQKFLLRKRTEKFAKD
ncbi:alpha/beta fold hydrolase [Reyranella sp.]|uniref:alpha/beta hydrolase n=1 Tax=Reyranella sp. TaxID=1929291 RepID=UPI0027306609|nr:alpha/beta hydrolase [Reyranella sp.]MDP2376940.1 alpha/beta hydrolase [Reyranella sp.]